MWLESALGTLTFEALLQSSFFYAKFEQHFLWEISVDASQSQCTCVFHL